ncbi:MAG: cobalt ECF transporter T component CbiQ [Anaerolineales bacterium]|nr:cobalt ECF transporter T component CbiQ [Anaerolineales bacterium]
MHDSIFDRYHAGNSLLHRLDPRLKVVFTVVFIFSHALRPDGAWLAYTISWIFLIASNQLSGLGVGFTTKRSFIVLPFALAAITAIFSLPGRPLAEWTVGPWHLIATDLGVLRFASIMVRSWLSVQGAILLVATTQFPDLIHAFEHLRIPRLLVMIIAFLYRYLFVITDEVMRMMHARQSREAAYPGRKTGGTILWRAHVTGNMVGQLFLRSYERSDRIYHAMLARGYEGQIRTINRHKMMTRDWLFAALAAFAVLIVQIVGHFFLR